MCVIEPGAIQTPAVGKTLGGVERTIAELPPEGAALYGEAMRRMSRAFARFLPEKLLDVAVLGTFGLLRPAH